MANTARQWHALSKTVIMAYTAGQWHALSANCCGQHRRGWKMLGEHCPVTGSVPLMQNKAGRKYSVAVGKFVDEISTEEESGCDTDDLLDNIPAGPPLVVRG